MKSVLAFIAAALAFASTAGLAADKVTFQLDWVPSGEKAPVYVGIRKGFFAAEGLEVTLQAGRGSFDAVTKLAAGAADVGHGGFGAVMQAYVESAVPVKAIMSVFTKMPDALLTWKGSGITSIMEMKGKALATATYSGSNPFIPIIFRANGIDPATVVVKKTDPTALAGLLASGQVEATVGWLGTAPGTAMVLKSVGKEMVTLPWSDIGFDGYGYALFAADKAIKERRDVVARFYKAYRKSLEYAVANPGEAGAAIKAIVPEVDLALSIEQFTAAIPLIKNEITQRDGLGSFNPKLVKATWEWLAKSQNYPMDKIDPLAVVDASFVGSM